MATSTQSLLTAVNTDADYRTLCQAIETALAACGLVRTADTNQTDLTTVTKPTATWATNVKRMWRFNDAEQSVHPVFLLLTVGVGNPNTMPSFNLTWGTATDGACNLVGSSVQLSNGFIRSYASSSTYCQWSGDGSRLSFSLWHCSNNLYENLFSIERSPAGGCMAFAAIYNMNNNQKRSRWLPYTGSLGQPSDATSGYYLPFGLTTGIVGNEVYAWGYRAYNPVESPGSGGDLLLYFVADLMLANNYTVVVSGTPKVYRTVGLYNYNLYNMSRENSAACNFLMRFE